MRLTARDARNLAEALESMTKMTRSTSVRLDPCGPADLQIEGVCIKFVYDSDEGYGEYVISDRVGH